MDIWIGSEPHVDGLKKIMCCTSHRTTRTKSVKEIRKSINWHTVGSGLSPCYWGEVRLDSFTVFLFVFWFISSDTSAFIIFSSTASNQSWLWSCVKRKTNDSCDVFPVIASDVFPCSHSMFVCGCHVCAECGKQCKVQTCQIHFYFGCSGLFIR